MKKICKAFRTLIRWARIQIALRKAERTRPEVTTAPGAEERLRTRKDRYGKKYTPEEDMFIIQARNIGVSHAAIARDLGRTEGSVSGRYSALKKRML